MKSHLIPIAAALCVLISCRTLPERLSQASLTEIGYEVSGDSLSFKFNNPLDCPLRIGAASADPNIQKLIEPDFPVVIGPLHDTLLIFAMPQAQEEVPINLSATLGDPKGSVLKDAIHLPFPQGNKYEVIQGYNGKYSHTTEYSKYAIDFNLREGDTICAVADGFVVGVIEGYTEGGRSKRWKDYANYITLFHPEMNLYTQYVHLTHEGSLVKVGDVIKAEQPIGLSGKTGQTDMEHLHFNVLKPNGSGMESTPIEFREGYKGEELERGDWVER